MNVVDEIQCSTTTHCAVETNWKRVASELSDFFFLVTVAATMLLENVNESLHHCRHRDRQSFFAR